jgi:hypothetical protein
MFPPLMGMLMRKFILENPRTDNIMMFYFTDFEHKCLCRP